ncbi:hypothetical protein RUR49_16305 [Pseudoxanthobacter sp. M-2]|uniref:hypothetical protein n=1 Tax=Pseudoxanthobacter sp. M-2 TaxID=3078754 RepID=UPI0038FC115F
MPTPTRQNRVRLRRIRHMDYDLVRNVSFQSLSFFGTIALLVAVAFNMGMFARFGMLFISVLNPRDMVMTAFVVIAFLSIFYGASLALVSQATLAYEILTVLRRRRPKGMMWHFLVAAGASLIIAVLLIGFFYRFATYRGMTVPPALLIVLALSLVVLVLSSAFITAASRRTVIALGALHVASLAFTSVVFGNIVTVMRENFPSTIVFNDGKEVVAGVVLVTSDAVFYRLPLEGGGFTSHYARSAVVANIRQ